MGLYINDVVIQGGKFAKKYILATRGEHFLRGNILFVFSAKILAMKRSSKVMTFNEKKKVWTQSNK